MRIIAVFSLLLTVACHELPKKGTIVLAPVSSHIRELTFSSGLRVLAEQDITRPVVALALVLDVGGADDPQGKEGLSHLLEHITFSAQPDGQATIDHMLQYVGAVHNGQTGFEVTTYYSEGPNNMLAHMLRVEAARLKYPLANVDEERLNVTRELVRNELIERDPLNLHTTTFGQLLHQLFPPTFAYSRPVGGTINSLSRIQLADLQQHVRQFYQPTNATIIISGDIDLDKIDELIQTAFTDELLSGTETTTPAKEAEFAQPAEVPDPPPGKLKMIEATTAQPQVWVAWSIPGGFDEQMFLNPIVVATLTARIEGRFYDNDDVLEITPYYMTETQASVLVLAIDLLKDDAVLAQEVVEEVLDELYSLWNVINIDARQVTDKMVRRLRLIAGMGLTLNAEQRRYRVLTRAESLRFTGAPDLFTKMVDAIYSVDTNAIRDYFHHYINRERPARFTFVPEFILLIPNSAQMLPFETGRFLPLFSPELHRTAKPLPFAQILNSMIVFDYPTGWRSFWPVVPVFRWLRQN